MTSAAKTFGYARQTLVPKLEGTTPKVCKTCETWFASRPREQRCDDCLSANERLRRFARLRYAELEAPGAYDGSQRRSGTLQPTHTGTPRRRVRAQAPQVIGVVNDGGELCRSLALELAEKIDYPKGRPVKMSRAFKHAITLRNVNAGKQGRCDLERLS